MVDPKTFESKSFKGSRLVLAIGIVIVVVLGMGSLIILAAGGPEKVWFNLNDTDKTKRCQNHPPVIRVLDTNSGSSVQWSLDEILHNGSCVISMEDGSRIFMIYPGYGYKSKD